MASEVEICNMALDRIGIDQAIVSMDDGDLRARKCKLWYEHCRDKALSGAPWNWALRVAALAEVVDTLPPGWSKMYRYPADCLALRDITDSGGARISAATWIGAFYNGWQGWTYPRYSWEVRGEPVSDTGKIVLVDCSAPYALYVRRVVDPNQFDVQFRDALAWCLAIELATALKANAVMRKQAVDGWTASVAEAQARFMREQRSDRAPDSPSIQARG